MGINYSEYLLTSGEANKNNLGLTDIPQFIHLTIKSYVLFIR